MFVTRGITFIFSHNYEKSMKRQCVNLELPNHLEVLVNRAVELVRQFDENSRVRENADLFVKFHIVPVNTVLKINEQSVSVSINALNIAAITRDGIIIKYPNAQFINCKKYLKDARGDHMYITDYMSTAVGILNQFYGYFICGQVLNYLILSHETLHNGSLLKHLRCDLGKCIKLLNQLLNTILCCVTYRNDAYGSLTHRVLLDLTEKLGGKVIMMLMVGEDCTYLGVIDGNYIINV
jgi:hypothetical protein